MNWDNGMIEEPINPVTPTPQTYGVTDLEKATWNAKQSALTFDSHATKGSTNPVTSDGISKDLDALETELVQAYQTYFQGQVNGLATLAATVSGVVAAAEAARNSAQNSADISNTNKDLTALNTEQTLSYLDATSRINGFIEQMYSEITAMYETFLSSYGLGLGETEDTAYRGDRGKLGYEHSLVVVGNPHQVTKTEVGLPLVDNTADADKPISIAEAAALALKADLVAGLVPTNQLPSYVDDVLEFINTAAFPVTGEENKIYVDTTANLTYRWTGTQYTEISKSLALGETAATAYYGDKGKAAYEHSLILESNAHNTPALLIPTTIAGLDAINIQGAVEEVLGKLSGCYVDNKDGSGNTTADLYLHY